MLRFDRSKLFKLTEKLILTKIFSIQHSNSKLGVYKCNKKKKSEQG